MLERYSFHTNSLVRTLAPLINCVIDDALLEAMPDRSAGTVSSFSQKCQYAVPARTGTL